jgi:branched-chain amino acid transport system permease protein
MGRIVIALVKRSRVSNTTSGSAKGSARLGRTEPGIVLVLALLGVVCIGLELTQGYFNLFLLNSCLIAAIAASGLNLAMGQAGLVSVGSAAFLCTGSFSAVISGQWGVPRPLTVLVALAVGAVLGAIFSIPSARLSGLYFALATLAAQTLILYFATQYQRNKVGEAGFITVPWFSSKGLLTEQRWWTLLLGLVLAGVLLALSRYRSGRAGRAWRQLRDSDLAATATGVRGGLWRVGAMTVSSALIAGAGALQYYFSGTVSADDFTLLISVQYIAMVLLGGADSIMGPVLGAAAITLLPTLSNDVVRPLFGASLASRDGAQIGEMLYGLLIVVVVVGPIGGLNGGLMRLIATVRTYSQRLIRRRAGKEGARS